MMMVYHPVRKDKSGRHPIEEVDKEVNQSFLALLTILLTLLLVDQKALMETLDGSLWHHLWPSADGATRSSPFPIFSVDDGW